MPTLSSPIFKSCRTLLTVPALALILLACAAAPAKYSFPQDPDVRTLQQAMSAKQLSAVELTQHYLDRIATWNSALLAVVEVNPDALAIAIELDKERADGMLRSPLHGIPVLLKDNIDTADRMKSTGGSLALMDAPVPAQDAFVVQQLRAAGAIILGKANLSEWANFRSETSSSGWSARGGQTVNAYNAEITPCGSSAGSAVAVSADLTVLAVGTETDGSLICPASNNGIVSIKPTLGLISRSGIIPIAHSQDTAGPMTRTVADAAAMLSGMTGADAGDPITVGGSISALDYSSYLQRGSLQGKRIGVLRHLSGRNPAVDQLLDLQLAVLRQGGATLVDLHPEIPAEMGSAEYQVLLYEFKHGLNQYLQQRGGNYASLADLILFNESNAEQEMPWFAQEIFLQAQEKGDLTQTEYLEALSYSKRSSQGLLNQLLEGEQLDALVAPSNGPGWKIDLENGDNGSSVNYVSSASLAAISGYPSITVPAGFINDLPIGISFIGAAFSEPELIAIAYDYEQRSMARRPPALRHIDPPH